MNAPVVIALAIVAFFGIWGFKDGVVKRVLEIAGVLVSLVLTARFATAVAPTVQEKTGTGDGPALLITWALLFLVGLLLSRVVAAFASRLVRLTILGWLDRWGGAIVGMALGTLVASVLLVAASSVPGAADIRTESTRTGLGRFIYYAAPSVVEQVQHLAGDDVRAAWDRALDVAKEKAETGREKAEESARDALDR